MMQFPLCWKTALIFIAQRSIVCRLSPAKKSFSPITIGCLCHSHHDHWTCSVNRLYTLLNTQSSYCLHNAELHDNHPICYWSTIVLNYIQRPIINPLCYVLIIHLDSSVWLSKPFDDTMVSASIATVLFWIQTFYPKERSPISRYPTGKQPKKNLSKTWMH